MADVKEVKEKIENIGQDIRNTNNEIYEDRKELKILQGLVRNEREYLPIAGIGFFFIAVAITEHGLYGKIAAFISGALLGIGLMAYYVLMKHNEKPEERIVYLKDKIYNAEERIKELEKERWGLWDLVDADGNEKLAEAFRKDEKFKEEYMWRKNATSIF